MRRLRTVRLWRMRQSPLHALTDSDQPFRIGIPAMRRDSVVALFRLSVVPLLRIGKQQGHVKNQTARTHDHADPSHRPSYVLRAGHSYNESSRCSEQSNQEHENTGRV